MIFTNAIIFQGEKGFVKGSLWISENRIREILPEEERRASETERDEKEKNLEEKTDLQGCYILPGLVDIHTHGNSGCDFSDGKEEGLTAMGRYLAAHGITSFAPTSMTLPYEKLKTAFTVAADYAKDRPADGARMAGIHMEGPYFSEKKKGAQNSAFLKKPDIEGFEELQKSCGNLIRIVDIAPELTGSVEFIRRVSKECRVSLAHTDASYEEARAAFEAGASHVTHLFNAMPPIHHRKPGVIGAACERRDVVAELICDGLHVHPSVVRMAFLLFHGRICLISDTVQCCGMPDGKYELGGQQVFLRDGQVRVSAGNLAGAVSNLYDDMVNAIRFGIPTKDAVLAATAVPAAVLGMDGELGSLEAGKKADFIVCDREWRLKQVYIDGLRIG